MVSEVFFCKICLVWDPRLSSNVFGLLERPRNCARSSEIAELFFTCKNLYSDGSCDHIQGFQWLQLVINDGYGTPLVCHLHWDSQRGLEVVIEAVE